MFRSALFLELETRFVGQGAGVELADEGLERRWNEQEARKVENSGDLSIKMIFSTMETILFAKNKDCPLKLSCDRLKNLR